MNAPDLETQRSELASRRFLAMPLAGTLAWLSVAIAGLSFSSYNAAIWLFVATGMIVYLGLFISKFTGEHFGRKRAYRNAFDSLFIHTIAMALLVYAIAIPFFIQDHTSLPLTVGILTGLMWLPLSWMIQHWIGIFHAVTRTVSVLALWYLLPEHRFVAIPLAIVALYLVTIFVLETRWRSIRREGALSSPA